MIQLKPAPILLLLVATALPLPASAEERKEVARRADCVITVGDRQGVTDLIVADCQWAIPASKIVPVIKDAELHDEIFDSVVSSRKLGEGRFQQVHQASGISDREITLDFTTTTLPDGGIRVAWTRSARQEPVGEDNVAAPQDDGYWEVHDNGNGTSHVIYSLRYDPGGRVPSWVVRAFQKGGIADLVEEMRDWCARK